MNDEKNRDDDITNTSNKAKQHEKKANFANSGEVLLHFERKGKALLCVDDGQREQIGRTNVKIAKNRIGIDRHTLNNNTLDRQLSRCLTSLIHSNILLIQITFHTITIHITIHITSHFTFTSTFHIVSFWSTLLHLNLITPSQNCSFVNAKKTS
jgi:hypothetical protein